MRAFKLLLKTSYIQESTCHSYNRTIVKQIKFFWNQNMISFKYNILLVPEA